MLRLGREGYSPLKLCPTFLCLPLSLLLPSAKPPSPHPSYSLSLQPSQILSPLLWRLFNLGLPLSSHYLCPVLSSSLPWVSSSLPSLLPHSLGCRWSLFPSSSSPFRPSPWLCPCPPSNLVFSHQSAQVCSPKCSPSPGLSESTPLSPRVCTPRDSPAGSPRDSQMQASSRQSAGAGSRGAEAPIGERGD